MRFLMFFQFFTESDNPHCPIFLLFSYISLIIIEDFFQSISYFFYIFFIFSNTFHICVFEISCFPCFF